jgi:adenylate cyclase
MDPERPSSVPGRPHRARLRRLFILPLLGLVGVCAWLTWTQRAGLQASAFRRRLALRNPVSVALDTHGTLSVLDDKYFRILQIDRDGRVVRRLSVQPPDRAHYEYWTETAVDPEGALFAIKVVYLVENELVDYEQIIRYPPRGAAEVLYTLDHEKDEDTYDTRLLGLQARGGWLYFDVRGDEKVGFWRVPLAGGQAEHVLDIPASRAEVYNLAGTAPGSLWVTSYSGDRVFRLGVDGTLADARLRPAPPRKGQAAAPPVVLADKIAVDASGGLLLTDLFNQCVYRAQPDGSLDLRLTKADLPDRPGRALFKDIFPAADGSLAVVDSIGGGAGRVVVFDRDGRAVREVTGGVPSLGLWARMLAPWGALAALAVAAAAAVLFVYLVVLGRRVALSLKLVVAFVPVVIVAIAFITGRLFEQTFRKVEEEVRFRLAALAQAGSLLLDGDAVDRIRRPPDYEGRDYTKVAGQLKALVNSGDDPWNQRVYANVARLYNGMFYIMDDNAASYGVLYPVPLAPFDRYKAALDSGRTQTFEYTDADGTYLEAAAPIRTSTGDIVAILYVGSSKDDLLLLRQVFRSEVTRETAVATAVFLAMVVGVSVALLLSINKLRQGVGRMEAGDLGTEVRIRSRDEIGELGRGFNSMSGKLKATVTEVVSMKDAYKRFVPQEFLDFLHKEKVQDIELGNQVELNLAVLFCDIRDFTTLSEQMTPEDNFRFLNSFLGRMGPVIREAGGFVDKYMGDAIMALFPGGEADAVRAAVDLQRTLVTYNGHRAKSGYAPVAVGVGVHAGRMMLGIIGESERMEGTVIADAVNLASRLEGMTKPYGARIIVSERIIAAMGGEAPDHRYLGHAKVKGKSDGVPIYEIFAADPPADLRMKRRTKRYFETGVRLFLKGRGDDAARYFRAVLKAHPGDRAARQLAGECGRATAPTPDAGTASAG